MMYQNRLDVMKKLEGLKKSVVTVKEDAEAPANEAIQGMRQ